MKRNHVVLLSLSIMFCTLIGLLSYMYASYSPSSVLFTTKQPQKKSITRTIKATGFLEIEDSMRIGSLVEGIIKALCVTENEKVHKGQILAIIDDGKEDTRVRAAKALWEKAIAALSYQKSFYARQTILHEHNDISHDDFERFTRDYKSAVADVEQYKAEYDQAVLEFNNKTIRSPENGLVINQIAREGETVTLSAPATVLYIIAKDITKIKAKLEVDERSISFLHKNMQAHLIVDAYPYQTFSGMVANIGNTAKIKHDIPYYEVTVHLDNTQQLLKDGMTVRAEIIAAHKEHAMSIPQKALSIHSTALEQIAQVLGLTIQPSIKDKHPISHTSHAPTVWVLDNSTFIERPIEVGISNTMCCEVISGLAEHEHIVVDVAENNV